ncbi:hypothetical protein NHF46_13675 [Arthrobacter alpinus]|nr:hypothetical protein [Arthrobacter alpinus]
MHPDGTAFTLDTSAGEFTARHVVIATGATKIPFVPDVAGQLSPPSTRCTAAITGILASFPAGAS